MNKNLVTLVNAVISSADGHPARCKGCIFDFTDADGYHQVCFEDRWIVGGCNLLQPCGAEKFEEINSSPNKKHVATLEFDFTAQKATMTGTGRIITVSAMAAVFLGERSFEEKEYDPWTDPGYQLDKVCWLIHQKTGHWAIYTVIGQEYFIYTDGDRAAVLTTLLEYFAQGKLQFFNITPT